MTTPQKQRLLHVVTAAAWCGTIAVTVMALLNRRAPAVASAADDAPPARPATSPSQSLATLDEPSLKAASEIRLQRPLIDAPPKARLARRPATTPAGGIALALQGTILEDGGTPYAVFVLPGGKRAIASVGDQVEGADVLEIERDRVTLRYGSDGAAKPFTLAVPRPRGAS